MGYGGVSRLLGGHPWRGCNHYATTQVVCTKPKLTGVGTGGGGAVGVTVSETCDGAVEGLGTNVLDATTTLNGVAPGTNVVG